MREVLVSVIIPIFNVANNLEDTVRSVFSSEYKNIEIILIDFGSTDNSLKIARDLQNKYSDIELLVDSGSGPSEQLNFAISKAKGDYIYPLAAGSSFNTSFVKYAFGLIHSNPDVKMVSSEEGAGKINTEKISAIEYLELMLKSENNLSGLFRKSDLIKTENSDISHLEKVSLNNNNNTIISKLRNVIARVFKSTEVFINPDYNNLTDFVDSLPQIFDCEGDIIYKGRNELRKYSIAGKEFVVKSYCLPHVLNRFIYRFFRSPKAVRSYEYAEKLRSIGINSPEPVAYCISRTSLLLGKSYFVSLKSETTNNYRDLLDVNFENRALALKAIARVTGIMHNNNIIHKDYSPGNILFNFTDNGVNVEIIDLNRMRFGNVGIKKGCQNFDRLHGTRDMFRIMADEYAAVRGFDADECYEMIIKYNKELDEVN